jgi:uncharacterized protein involved in exopolysaccharide biosynthesis
VSIIKTPQTLPQASPKESKPVPQEPYTDHRPLNHDPYYFDDYQPVSLLHYVNIPLRHRWLIVLCFILASVSAYITSKLATPIYEATAQFVSDPNATKNVAIAGSDLGGIQLRNPVDYYSNILKSTAVIDNVLNSSLKDSRLQTPDSKLLDLIEIPANSSLPREVQARNIFKGDILQLSASTRDSNIFNLKVQWRDPQTAATLANAFLDELIRYDMRVKSSTARQKRMFIEKQLQDNEKLLKEAEDKLRDFKSQNRLLYLTEPAGPLGIPRTNVAPDLQLEKDRREREVKLQTELYLILKRELELAKIAENNEASTLTVIEQASPPLGRTRPTTRNNVMLAAVVGLMLGIGLSFMIEYAAGADTESPDTREFIGHLASLRSDARKLLSIFSLGLISYHSSANEKTHSSP